MNVAELITELRKQPQDALVWVVDESGKAMKTPDEIELRSKQSLGQNLPARHDVYIRAH